MQSTILAQINTALLQTHTSLAPFTFSLPSPLLDYIGTLDRCRYLAHYLQTMNERIHSIWVLQINGMVTYGVIHKPCSAILDADLQLPAYIITLKHWTYVYTMAEFLTTLHQIDRSWFDLKKAWTPHNRSRWLCLPQKCHELFFLHLQASLAHHNNLCKCNAIHNPHYEHFKLWNTATMLQ